MSPEDLSKDVAPTGQKLSLSIVIGYNQSDTVRDKYSTRLYYTT